MRHRTYAQKRQIHKRSIYSIYTHAAGAACRTYVTRNLVSLRLVTLEACTVEKKSKPTNKRFVILDSSSPPSERSSPPSLRPLVAPSRFSHDHFLPSLDDAHAGLARARVREQKEMPQHYVIYSCRRRREREIYFEVPRAPRGNALRL